MCSVLQQWWTRIGSWLLHEQVSCTCGYRSLAPIYLFCRRDRIDLYDVAFRVQRGDLTDYKRLQDHKEGSVAFTNAVPLSQPWSQAFHLAAFSKAGGLGCRQALCRVEEDKPAETTSADGWRMQRKERFIWFGGPSCRRGKIDSRSGDRRWML